MNLGAALTRRWLSLPPRRCAVRRRLEWVALTDGVRLATQVLLPQDGARPWPAVLMRTSEPSHRPGHAAASLGRLIAESGFAVVLQECRGRHASEGRFAPFLNEAADGGDAIAWIASQEWFDGRLGLLGWGYSGFAAWAALSRSPRPVAALVAAFAARDPFAWLRPGGALALELALRWGVGVGEREAEDPGRLDLERGLSHRPLREADRVTLKRVDWFREWIEHPARDAYWEARSPALPEAPPPTLLIAGWRHPALAAQLADLPALREAARRRGAPEPELVIGPWPGGQPPRREARRTRSRAGAESLRAALDFLARRLRGEPAARAPVRVFMRGASVWREASAWPLPNARSLALHLRGGGRANGRTGDGALLREAPPGEEPADRYSYDPRDPALADDPATECRHDVLCYTTEPLPEPLLIGGPVGAVLFAESSAAVTDFTATLVALAPDGKQQTLCDGVLRSRGAPGETRRLELDLGAACARLETGGRLRLRVSSSAFPRWDRPSHTEVEPGAAAESEIAPARQTVFHDRERPSHLRLSLLES
ncbi:MAG TPA: CocE/NonD family hydrolase [Myxococcota bacterium]